MVKYSNDTVGSYTVGIKQNNEYTLEMLFIHPDYRNNYLETIEWKHIEQNDKYKIET